MYTALILTSKRHCELGEKGAIIIIIVAEVQGG